MASTTPGDLPNVSHDGDTEETPITNAMASEPGFPARTIDGELVSIVDTRFIPGNPQKILIDADGGEWVEKGPFAELSAYESADESVTESDEEPQGITASTQVQEAPQTEPQTEAGIGPVPAPPEDGIAPAPYAA